MKLSGILFLFFWGALTAAGQKFSIKRTPMMDRLLKLSAPVSEISSFPSYYNDQMEVTDIRVTRPNRFSLKFIKTDSGLFAISNGAGFVYKAVVATDDSIKFQAIDSTYYNGYNGNAIRFAYKQKLYSLGGYGFWHMSGYLLHFMPGKDWQIKALNKEVPVVLSLHSYDETHGLLYYFTPRHEEQPTGKVNNEQNFYQLDIEKQENKELGVINKNMEFLTSSGILINIPAMNAVMVEDQLRIFLVVISENKVYQLMNQKIIDRFKFDLLNLPNRGMIYSSGNFLFYNSNSESPVDSIKLTISDFELLEEPLYYPVKQKCILPFEWVTALFGIIIGMAGLWLINKFRKKKTTTLISTDKTDDESWDNDESDSENEKIGNSLFNDFEKHILSSILNREEPVNVHDINEMLGVKKKAPDFQKKIRTETISRINIKFRQVSESQENLIVRVRSNEDKRFIFYTISENLKTECRSLLVN